MKPFNLEAALAGEKVIQRNGIDYKLLSEHTFTMTE